MPRDRNKIAVRHGSTTILVDSAQQAAIAAVEVEQRASHQLRTLNLHSELKQVVEGHYGCGVGIGVAAILLERSTVHRPTEGTTRHHAGPAMARIPVSVAAVMHLFARHETSHNHQCEAHSFKLPATRGANREGCKQGPRTLSSERMVDKIARGVRAPFSRFG